MVDAHVEEVQRLWAENQKLKVRVGILGDQLSAALEGAMESWDDVERVQQEACGFALGAGMEMARAERERDNWMESVAQQFRNTDFYQGIVRATGELFGVEARTSDDGSIQDSVLATKVPELVAAALARAERLEKALRAHCDGVRRVSCSLCADSTYDHHCNDREEPCPKGCAAALREGKP
jgi:hypothetical protein